MLSVPTWQWCRAPASSAAAGATCLSGAQVMDPRSWTIIDSCLSQGCGLSNQELWEHENPRSDENDGVHPWGDTYLLEIGDP